MGLFADDSYDEVMRRLNSSYRISTGSGKANCSVSSRRRRRPVQCEVISRKCGADDSVRSGSAAASGEGVTPGRSWVVKSVGGRQYLERLSRNAEEDR
jgi:hypothetical protein